MPRKKSQPAAAPESAEQFQILAEHLPNIVFINQGGRVVYANRTAETTMGYTREELYAPNFNFLTLVAPEYWEVTRQHLTRHEQGEDVPAYEYEIVTRQGQRLSAIITTKLINYDGRPAVLGIITDITARKRAEERLQQSEEMFRTLVRTAPVAVMVTDLQGNFLELSDRAITLLGFASGPEARQSTFFDLLPAEELRQGYAIRQIILREGSVRDVEFRTLRPDGTSFLMEMNATLIREAHGQPQAIMATLRDITERKQTEQALRESEEKFRTLAEELPHMVFIHQTGHVVYVNKACMRLMGYQREEFYAPDFDFMVLIAPEDKEKVARSYAAHANRQEMDSYESAVITRDGRRLNTIITTRLFQYQGDLAILGIVIDITTQTKVGEALRESEEKYRSVVEACTDAIFLETLDGRILDCNQAACVMHGYSKAEILELCVRDLIPTELSSLLSQLAAQQKNLNDMYIQAYGRRKDGTVFPTEVSSRLVNMKGEQLLIVYLRDITERKRAEEQILFQAALLDQVRNGIVVTDLEGRITYWNQYAATLYQREFREVLGRPVSVLWEESNQEASRRAIQTILQTGHWEGEVLNLRKDGTTFPSMLHCTLIRNQQDQPIGLVGVSSDLTERKLLEARIQHAQKSESLAILAGGIAHDFNNLLMAIMGNAGLALMDIPAGAPGREYVEKIELASLHAAELTNQLLAYSGKGKFVVEPLDMTQLIEEITPLLKSIVSKKAELHFDLVPQPPWIEGDATQLRQVIINLVSNASDALEGQAGAIAIHTTTRYYTRAQLASNYMDVLLPDGIYVCIEVADTGCGMDEATQARIFDPFFTTKFTGRGLGMAAVLGIVRGHNGTIKVDSTVGMGTHIRVLLPCLEEARLPRADGTRVPRPYQGHGIMLLAEDEEFVRDVAKALLEKAGFTVLVATDGRAAVELFQAHAAEIALVLLDMTMPRMSGEEALQEIRRIRPDIKVILSSGYNEQEVGGNLIEKGLTGFIQKPYKPDTLLGKIRDLMDE